MAKISLCSSPSPWLIYTKHIQLRRAINLNREYSDMTFSYWCVLTSSSEKWQSNTRECFETCFVTSTTKFGADTISDWKQEKRKGFEVRTLLIFHFGLTVACERIIRFNWPLLLLSAVLLDQPLPQSLEECCYWRWRLQWSCKERQDEHIWAPVRIQSVAALLFSRHIPGEFGLCSVHLELPPSRQLWKTFVFLELLLLFDFIRQKITKCFVTWGNG